MVLFLSFIKKKNVLQRFLIFLLYFCKRMDSLFLFQFACFIFMLVNAFFVALSHLHAKWFSGSQFSLCRLPSLLPPYYI